MTVINNKIIVRPESAIQPTFVIYSREACHLCQEMICALRNLQAQKSFELEIIDIDSDPQLVALYGERVPVLKALNDQQEICHYYLDLVALDAYFAKIR
ncbi:MAG: glutaredoxin family protein [Nitrosomonas sp.]|nr:glutaredoxin family protein [Nitrosomonas sp.]MDP1951429.1 glutaredoxin family protein [Nitrosomonas sp.]